MQGDLHRGAKRLEAEFLLAAPLHADAMVRNLERDHCRIHRDIVCAIVAIAACAVRVANGDTVLWNAQHVGQSCTQGIGPLRVRPD